MRIITPVPPELLEVCYKIRYQVYVVDHSFIPDPGTGLETDADDPSPHCLLLDDNEVPIGCGRIILHPDNFAEVSRIGILKHVKDHKTAKDMIAEGIIKLSRDNNVNYWFGLMEPWFIKSLKVTGFNFHKIGPVVEYKGKRQACYLKVPYDWKPN